MSDTSVRAKPFRPPATTGGRDAVRFDSDGQQRASVGIVEVQSACWCNSRERERGGGGERERGGGAERERVRLSVVRDRPVLKNPRPSLALCRRVCLFVKLLCSVCVGWLKHTTRT